MVGVESLLDVEKVVFEVAEGVRLEIGEVSNIIFMRELVTKAESIQRHHLRRLIFILIARDVLLVVLIVRRALARFRLILILIITHVFASSRPVVRPILPILLGAVHERLHAYLVAGLVLLQVTDVELVLFAFGDVAD